MSHIPPSPTPHKPLPHLLMVSSSSESQKLVVSSSLLIMVLELSYPARWRSSRLCPFMRGPGTPQTSACCFRPSFFCFYLGVKFLTPACCDDISIFTSLGRWKRSSPCCSMLSLWRGLSLLKETTDSVSVCSSSVSTLPVAFGL